MYNYNKLIGRIVEKYGTRDAFANVLGWSRGKLSARLNNKTEFSQNEIALLCKKDLLDIPASQVVSYFFCRESSQS